MQEYEIGISGLHAAQRALDVIGNNISNAATAGYHRQRIEFVPAYASQGGAEVWGGGVKIAGITRLVDMLLEQELLRQKSILGQLTNETSMLSTIESAIGELSAGSALSAILDEFFNSMQELSAHPFETIWQNQTITMAQALTGQFRTLGEFMENTEDRMLMEAESLIEQTNTLIDEIAELNGNIQRMEINGGQASNLRDQRDQRITELAELVMVETREGDFGIVDVTVGSIPVVTSTIPLHLRVGIDENNKMGVAASGTDFYQQDMEGGKLGGLLSCRNEILLQINNDLDQLACAIMREVNNLHFQGLGSAGSFTELVGRAIPSSELTDLEPPITDGTIYIRVINTNTGQISRSAVDVDVTSIPPDTLATLAAKIDAVDGINASVAVGQLRINSDSGYEFDFLPAVLAEPTASNITTGMPPDISVSGIYTGDENQTLSFTTVGSGLVGNGTLQLVVRNGVGEVLSTLNIGSGYAAGDKLQLDNGVRIALGVGDLNDGDSFEVDVFACSDTSGAMPALGMNTFFEGTGAIDMTVCSEVADFPARLATSIGPDMNDNTLIVQLAGLREQALDDLSSLTPGEFYRRFVTNLGQEVASKNDRMDNVQSMLQNLTKRQAQVSGVDINDEAAQLMIFEQMYQAMARYMSGVQSMMTTLINIL